MARVPAEHAPSGPYQESTVKMGHATSRSTPEAADEVAEARGNLYRLLSSVFLAPPQLELLRQIVNTQFLDELSSLFGERAVSQLKEFAATADVDTDAAALKQEYMDLFGVPTGRYVSPFEDVHWGGQTGEERKWGPLLGDRAIAVIRKYREVGAEIDRACKELPTHVGVELSFMSFLCEREAAAIRDRGPGSKLNQETPSTSDPGDFRHMQSRFLNDHLNGWFPQLSETIQTKANSAFYRGLAVLSEEYLAFDSAFLAGAYAE